MFAALAPFGETASTIWPFAAGVLAFLMVAALVLMAIEFIHNLLK